MLPGCRPSKARALRVGDVKLELGQVTISARFSGNVCHPQRKGGGAGGVHHPDSLGTSLRDPGKALRGPPGRMAVSESPGPAGIQP